MKQSVFEKEISVNGKVRTVKGKVKAVLNYGSKIISGTHAGTHDDYTKTIPTHIVEATIEGSKWQSFNELETESSVLAASEKMIAELKIELKRMADKEPSKTFAEKMNEIFQDSK
jgi:hypothetical protein